MFESLVALVVFVLVALFVGWKITRPYPQVSDVIRDAASQATEPQEALERMVCAALLLVPKGQVVALPVLAGLVSADAAAVAKLVGRMAEPLPEKKALVPWWRVVRKKGADGQLLNLSETLVNQQKKRLIEEGMVFWEGLAVDLARHEWQPPQRGA